MSIHVWKQYTLSEHYDVTIANLDKIPALNEYIANQDYFKKDNNSKAITYKTELLCPFKIEGRIPVLLLFSNPHPNSIMAGMFLSPIKAVNQFWISMQSAEMFKLPCKSVTRKEDFPEPIRRIFLNLEYDSLFAYYFYTFFSFPSGSPEELKKIFGSFFDQDILPESRVNLLKFLNRNNIKHVICFGKQAFQYISNYSEADLAGYTKNVKEQGFLHSEFIYEKDVNLYLTCPTGQGGCEAKDRINSLKCIKDGIIKHAEEPEKD